MAEGSQGPAQQASLAAPGQEAVSSSRFAQAAAAEQDLFSTLSNQEFNSQAAASEEGLASRHGRCQVRAVELRPSPA